MIIVLKILNYTFEKDVMLSTFSMKIKKGKRKILEVIDYCDFF